MKIDFTNFFSSDFRDVNSSSSNVMMPKQEMNGVQMPYKEEGAPRSLIYRTPHNGGQPISGHFLKKTFVVCKLKPTVELV